MLGQALPAAGFDLVYGGAAIGLMGRIADAVLDAGGSVIGVMPESLAEREIAHSGLTELEVTTSMHDRKTRMADLSDAFIAMPGGLGTLEELFEIWTWAQLGFHQKPIGLLNVDGYYDALLTFLDQSAQAGFVKTAHRDMLLTSGKADELISMMQSFKPESIAKV